MRFLVIALLLISAVFSNGNAAAGTTAGISSDEALRRLMDGNKRFVESAMVACKKADPQLRGKLVNGQQPYAVVLSCSDSRVPPEVIFDASLGEIFVVRVAGNVGSPEVIGSIEYAVEHLGSSLIMVMGHQSCGAVISTYDAESRTEGNIGSVTERIALAVRKAKQETNGTGRKGRIEAAVDINIINSAENILNNSRVLSELVKKGKIKIVKAKYSLETGRVILMKQVSD